VWLVALTIYLLRLDDAGENPSLLGRHQWHFGIIPLLRAMFFVGKHGLSTTWLFWLGASAMVVFRRAFPFFVVEEEKRKKS
jgi:hypothetical protein